MLPFTGQAEEMKDFINQIPNGTVFVGVSTRNLYGDKYDIDEVLESSGISTKDVGTRDTMVFIAKKGDPSYPHRVFKHVTRQRGSAHLAKQLILFPQGNSIKSQ